MHRLLAMFLSLPAMTAVTAPVNDPEPDWSSYQADVVAVRITTDQRSLLLTLAKPNTPGECFRNPQIGYYEEANNHIYANVTHEARYLATSAGCPTSTPDSVTLTSADPIDGRIVVLNQQSWMPDGDRYRRCDDRFGCTPPPADHCDQAWIRAAVSGLDVSRHSTGDVERCDQQWLVMTVPDDPVPCGAAPRDGCIPVITVRRYFLAWREPYGWSDITSSRQAGCQDVLTVEPAFPTGFCVDLPQPS